MKPFTPIKLDIKTADNIPNIVDVLENNEIHIDTSSYKTTFVTFLGKVTNVGKNLIQLISTATIAGYNVSQSTDGSVTDIISNTMKTAKTIKDNSEAIFDQYYAASQLIIELEFLNAILENFIEYYNALGNFSNTLKINICFFETYKEFIHHVQKFLDNFKSYSIDYILSILNPIKYRLYIKELISWNNIFFENMLSQYTMANNAVDKINMDRNISFIDYNIAISKISKKLSCNKEIILNKIKPKQE